MGLLVSTDLTWPPFVPSAGCVWFFCIIDYQFGLLAGPGVCGRRRAFPRFSSLLGKRGKRSRSALPIVHLSTGGSRRLWRGVTKASG
jgi:hypothetical protein